MTKYLVIKIRKHFNGAFSTYIVAEFYNPELCTSEKNLAPF